MAVVAPPGAQTVLLCGVGCDGDAWKFSGIQGETHMYPGLGGRPREPGWTLNQVADEIVARFKGPLDLVGQSQGAGIAMNLIIRHPDRVRSAVLACAGFHPVPDPKDTPDRAIAKVHGTVDPDTRQRIIDTAKREGMAAIADTFIDRWFTKPAIAANHPGVVYMRSRLLALDPEAFGDQWTAMNRSLRVTGEHLSAIKVPVTVLAGMEDRSSGVAGPAAIHSLIANCRMEVVLGGHFNYLEEGELYGAAVARHFAWLQKGGGRNEFIYKP